MLENEQLIERNDKTHSKVVEKKTNKIHSKVTNGSVVKAHLQMAKKKDLKHFALKKVDQFKAKKMNSPFFLEDHILYFERVTYTFISMLHVLFKSKAIALFAQRGSATKSSTLPYSMGVIESSRYSDKLELDSKFGA